MLLAAQILPTYSPINVVSTASEVPAPTASQFSRELEDIRVAEVLISMREGSNTTHRSHTLDTIPETQDLDLHLEVVLPNVIVGVATCHMKKIVDDTLHMRGRSYNTRTTGTVQCMCVIRLEHTSNMMIIIQS